MVTCTVTICKNNSGKIMKKDGITFHRFPRDEDRRKQWELSINREKEWTSTYSSTICSEHFAASDFYLTESGLRRLSASAVPSYNISPCQEPQTTIRNTDPIIIEPTDTPEVIELKHKVKRLEVLAEDRKRRLNLMRQSRKRLKKKLERMKTLIQHLIKHKKEMNSVR